jgi:hypothetical protein
MPRAVLAGQRFATFLDPRQRGPFETFLARALTMDRGERSPSRRDSCKRSSPRRARTPPRQAESVENRPGEGYPGSRGAYFDVRRRWPTDVIVAIASAAAIGACAQLEKLSRFELVACVEDCGDAAVDAAPVQSVDAALPAADGSTSSPVCPRGYSGPACATNIDDCTPDPCVAANSTGCVDGIADYTCTCKAGYGGKTCATPPTSCSALKKASPGLPDGVYTIDPDGGAAPFAAYCDMTTAGGGWTLALNLDTSDGHVMWWGNPLWTDANLHGNVDAPFAGDLKGAAWNAYATATRVLLVVHQAGAILGWKSFLKANAGATLFTAMQGGDNTPLATSVIDSFAADALAPNERLVRLSTALFANHCVESGGSCTADNGGSPDGDRIGSNEGTPSDNDGGGLGNWHDMNFCCVAATAGGHTCNGSAFRTAAEAQIDWGVPGCGYGAAGGGVLGTDSFAPASATCSDATCTNANWSALSGLDYDYALYLAD